MGEEFFTHFIPSVFFLRFYPLFVFSRGWVGSSIPGMVFEVWISSLPTMSLGVVWSVSFKSMTSSLMSSSSDNGSASGGRTTTSVGASSFASSVSSVASIYSKTDTISYTVVNVLEKLICRKVTWIRVCQPKGKCDKWILQIYFQ